MIIFHFVNDNELIMGIVHHTAVHAMWSEYCGLVVPIAALPRGDAGRGVRAPWPP